MTPSRASPGAADLAAESRGLPFKIGQGNVVVLAPPLVVDESDLERALAIVAEAIECLS